MKYWDPRLETGNREVFATVVASRLMWALGFEAVPVRAIEVLCDGCPEDPMEGRGARQIRHSVALLETVSMAPVILSKDDVDRGDTG